MSAEKKIKTNIQNSTLNSLFDDLSKWHDPHIRMSTKAKLGLNPTILALMKT